MSNQLPTLSLPRRFEALQREAKTNDADLARIVQRVDDAATRVEDLLRQARDGGIGRFEVFLGKPGSGKTTFFSTLNKFFQGVEVHEIGKEIKLNIMPDHIRKYIHSEVPSVWFIHDRDNPILTKEAARAFAESLRPLFREPSGRLVLIWPITDEVVAKLLAESAWEIGRDSLVDVHSRGLYLFQGLEKKHYYEIADLTVRNLRPGQSLETFGLTKERVLKQISESETIGEFYSRLEAESQIINRQYRDILKQRIMPHVWILVGGDSNQDLNMTISSLTQGRDRQIDIDTILAFLDEEDQDRAYLRDWKSRRNDIAFLLRRFDARVMEIPPNAALAAIRLFGDDAIKKPLNLKSTARASGIDAIAKTAFVRLLAGDENLKRPSARQTELETADEYRRIQNLAAKGDKRLNKPLAEALLAILSQEMGDGWSVSSDRRLEGGRLKPDILIQAPNGELYCLEVTWRTTGKGVGEEIEKRQNTLSVGHIQKYVLEKIADYVKEFNL